MNNHHIACLALFAVAASASAQTWTYPLDPRAAYLRTNNDSPLPPLLLDLTGLGIAPGTWVRIGTTGAFRYINGGTDTHRSLCAVFAADATLLATSVQQRVPAAIAAGPAFTSPSTYYGNLPMDVPQDFFCSRNLWDDAVHVEVPVGATHLFLGVHDSFYSDNVDPNGDYAVVISVLPTPDLPGTGEHVTLQTAVSGPTALLPEVHPAAPGSTMLAEIHHPLGFLDGALYVFVADTMPTCGAPPQLLPRVWLGNIVIVQFGVIANTPGWFASWMLTAPSGLPGTTLLVQGGALSPSARNTIYETTNAHRFVLQ